MTHRLYRPRTPPPPPRRHRRRRASAARPRLPSPRHLRRRRHSLCRCRAAAAATAAESRARRPLPCARRGTSPRLVAMAGCHRRFGPLAHEEVTVNRCSASHEGRRRAFERDERAVQIAERAPRVAQRVARRRAARERAPRPFEHLEGEMTSVWHVRICCLDHYGVTEYIRRAPSSTWRER